MNTPLRIGMLCAAAALAAACSHDEPRTQSAAHERSVMRTTTPDVETRKKPEKITKFADENKDGKVTKKEAKADPALTRVFNQYDLDKNGELDRGEWARLEGANRGSEFSRLESDDDYEADELRRVAEMDLDDSLEERADRAAHGDPDPTRPRVEYAHPR